MRTLVVYGNHKNQKLATDAGNLLNRAGHAASVRPADHPTDPVGYDAAIVVASLRNGRYDGTVLRFAREHFVVLNTMPTALVSVSRMSGNGRSHDVEAKLWEAAERLRRTTFWRPPVIHHTADSGRLNGNGLFGRIVNGVALRIGMIPAAEYEMRELSERLALARFLDKFVAPPQGTVLGQGVPPPEFTRQTLRR